MTTLRRLTRLYEDRGILVSSGLNPVHFDNLPEAAFTWFIKDGRSLTNGLGIALQEVYFLECLFARFRPERIFVIGNASGWSTFALALLNPAAKILAIDGGFDRNALAGLDFTNRVAAEEGLAVVAVNAVSPADVAPVLSEHGMAPLDFAFIDGYHSIAQVEIDFDAIRPLAAPACIYLFHDVLAFGLEPGLERVAAKSGLAWRLLHATTSGMAIAYDPRHRPAGLDEIEPFIGHPIAATLMREQAWNRRHRHLARWRRSLGKRLRRQPAGAPSFNDG